MGYNTNPITFYNQYWAGNGSLP